jgi:hypothetical protein
MKLFTTGFFLLIFVSTFSQLQFVYDSDYMLDQFEFHPLTKEMLLNDDGCMSIIFTSTRKKKTSTKIFNFQENGDLESREIIKEGKRSSITYYTYENNVVVGKKSVNEEGEVFYDYQRDLNANGKETRIAKFGSKERLETLYEKEYNEVGDVVEARYYKGKNKKLKSTWKYEYYSPKQMKRSMHFNKKGKMTRAWNYDCNEEGEQEKPKKDEDRICILKEFNGEFMTRIYQSTNDKGQIRKSVNVIRVSDSSLVEIRMYDLNDQLTYHAKYLNDITLPTEVISYKNGEQRTKTNYEYSGKVLRSSIAYRKGKETSKYLCELNDKNQIRSIGNYYKGKLKSKTSFSYIY